MDILALPTDIFLIVIEYLSPRNIVALRRVSKGFNTALSDDDLSHRLLLRHYPSSREARRDVSTSQHLDWSHIFRRVVSRYYHLHLATPASIKRFALAKSVVLPEWSKHYPIAPWRRHLHFEGRFAPFHYPDTLWTYDDGLLLYPSAYEQNYVLYDVESRRLFEIDIGSQSKVVRRMRLRDRVLVVEWCEPEPFHQLNETEIVHRHFATAFDVVWCRSSYKWIVVFRNEWKIHFLGMALNARDRFFSTHNKNHYALYLWQPNRSAWGEDEPIETLSIWDISSPSSYRPSEDPSGKSKSSQEDCGPKSIKRFSFSDLDFYHVRQRDTPSIQRLEIDYQHVYIIQENHRWMDGDHASPTVPRLHEVKTTGLPFYAGPHWENSCGVDGDPERSFCQKQSQSGQPHLAPCWRHEDFPYLTVAEVSDTKAAVSFSARQCFTMETINIRSDPDLSGTLIDSALSDEFWQQLLAKGTISGDERWLIGENSRNEVVILYFDEEVE